MVQTDETHQKQIIRGLFSSSLLSQQLSMDITADLSKAQSIVELQRDLHE